MSSISRSIRRARSTTRAPSSVRPPWRSIDERDAELLLEPGDVAGDVRLHGEQRPRRGGERAVVGDGDERGELPDIHLEKR